jgi:phospholipid/cholesterol/gamma-HCH transport system substrate-binding protein
VIKRIPALVKGPIIIALFVGLLVVAMKAAYGGYGHYYYLSMDLPRAGQQLQPGSDVRLRGVIIGKVQTIDLVDRHVHITLQIDQPNRVPRDVEAFIDLKTLLGSKFVDLRTSSYRGPFLADGARIPRTHVGPELEDALASGVQVLDAIRPNDLATIVHELATGARGHGSDIARSLRANAELSTLFAGTLDPQLRALHDFRVIFGALRNKGVDLNHLADAINEGVPVYASKKAQHDLDLALQALTPFSNNLADLFILNRHDWDRMMDSGDRVLGAVAARPEGLRSLVQGLYRYVYRLGGAPPRLRDGTAAAPFTNFIGGNSDAENRRQICQALPPEARKLAPLCNGTLP